MNTFNLPFLTATLFFLAGLVLASCNRDSKKQLIERSSAFSDYPISPVDIRHVKLTDSFWLPILKRVQEKTIQFALEKCQEEGRFDNFLVAGGQKEGETKGFMPFDDTDVYKIIEGASNSLISSPNDQLEALLDSLIAIIAVGQEDDGYLTTWRTIDPAKPPATWVKVVEGRRWESLAASHELYNAGHLYEAASVHFRATGKRNFLNIALKNADLMVRTFGEGKIETVPGHQIIETGLIQLFRITGNSEYLNLARYFLDTRGDDTKGRALFGPYSQDHLPVVQQSEVVGHAVRAVYMYAGMTDIAAIFDDNAYRSAVEQLWEDMTSRKLYVTGGIGARRDGEAFGDAFELPNATAYSETCAAIGSVYWNHRLFMMNGERKYYEIIERTLYNGLLSGLSLDGEQFFYPNALESDGVYTFNRGKCTRQDWFDCSCCPTNMIRFIPAVGGLIYAKTGNDLYVNLYAGNEANVQLANGEMSISQSTDYPWNGNVRIEVYAPKKIEARILLRIPAWVQGQVATGALYRYQQSPSGSYRITVDGDESAGRKQGGYFVISRNWEGSSIIDIEFPMEVQLVIADDRIEADRNKAAIEYGPIVYAIEEIDNPEIEGIQLSGTDTFEVVRRDDLLEGVNVINSSGTGQGLMAIPYYAWSNRGIGKMKVWIPMDQ